MLEYTILNLKMVADLTILEFRLNSMARAGWRLICQVNFNEIPVLIFEREKQPTVVENKNDTVLTYLW